MTRKEREKLSLWERSAYEILERTETETETISVIRNTFNGATIVCREPKHTPEEQAVLNTKLAKAMAQVAYSGQDISRFSGIKIITE